MINYCLPIIKKNKSEVLKQISENQKDYQFCEVWVDYIEKLDDEFIEKIAGDLEEKLIIVFRRQNLETTQLSFAQRIDIINIARNHGSFIDLDITTQEEELGWIKEKNIFIKTIISYHNYSLTPNDQLISVVIEKMKTYKPFIYKIATMCQKEDDALRLLHFIFKFREENIKFIILGMGNFGIITRIFGPLWGNEITFAPIIIEEKSALGQLTRAQLETIFSTINK